MTSRQEQPVSLIYHIAFPGDWEAAKAQGEYRMSTRGRTLEEQGFIHASGAHQVAGVATMFYSDVDELIVLAIDPGLLHSEVRYEQVPGSDEPFPHIYGPLEVGAVVETVPLGSTAEERLRQWPASCGRR